MSMKTCRLCLNDDSFSLNLFSNESRYREVLNKIKFCIPIVKVIRDAFNMEAAVCELNIIILCLSLPDFKKRFQPQTHLFQVPQHLGHHVRVYEEMCGV